MTDDMSAGAPNPTGDPSAVWDTFEQIPLIMGGFHGPDHVFDATNAAYREWMGHGSVIGRPASSEFPELIGQELYVMFDRVMETGEASFTREWRFQADLTDDGEMQEFYLDLMLGPRRGPDGAVSGVTLWAINVTERVQERQRAQQQTAEAEQRYQAAREVVIDLQQALLPTDLPVLPGFDVAAQYLVASQDQAAGGDWFDAVEMPDGSLAVVVGDIVGHGVTASSAMGQLRSVLNVALLETGDLTQTLEWANRMAARSPVMRAATVCVATLDPVSGRVLYATCGHPRPLVVGVDGSTRYLPAAGGGPLGTGSTIDVAEAVLMPGELLMLYSDGLVERRGYGMDERMTTLARVAGNAAGNRVMPLDTDLRTVARVCRHSVEALTRPGYDDDVTVLAVQRRPHPIGALRRELLAAPTTVTEVRTALRGWLAILDLPRRDALRLDIAVTELVANAVEHAYPPGAPGAVRLSAELGADGVLSMGVGDDGTWREPVGPEDLSGRGLWMAGASVDQLTIDHPAAGTTVTLRHRLRRPATLASQPEEPTSAGPDTEFAIDVEPGPPRVLRVAGPLDIVTAATFADRLDIASRGGLHPVVIDLTHVDVLASAGVRVLFGARDEHAVHGHALNIDVTAGSSAQQILELVGLDHHADQ